MKKKFNLADLKVKSFCTTIDAKRSVRGGAHKTVHVMCTDSIGDICLPTD